MKRTNEEDVMTRIREHLRQAAAGVLMFAMYQAGRWRLRLVFRALTWLMRLLARPVTPADVDRVVARAVEEEIAGRDWDEELRDL